MMTEGDREGLSVSCLRFGLQPGPGALPFREMHKKKGAAWPPPALPFRDVRTCTKKEQVLFRGRLSCIYWNIPFFGIFIYFFRIFNCTQTQDVLRGCPSVPKNKGLFCCGLQGLRLKTRNQTKNRRINQALMVFCACLTSVTSSIRASQRFSR